VKVTDTQFKRSEVKFTRVQDIQEIVAYPT